MVRRILSVSLVVLLGGCLSMARGGALLAAHESFAEGKYQEAIVASDEALSYGSPDPKDVADAYLIKAKSLEALGETDEAIGLYVFLVQTFPGTPHDFQARGRLQKLEALQPAESPI